MGGRSWHSERQSLENRIARLTRHAERTEDDELQAELAKYLCILVASLIDVRCGECAWRFAEKQSSSSVASFVSARLRRIPKSSCNSIRDLFTEFDPDRAVQWFDELPEEQRDAVDSIRNNRNQLAHGRYVGLSLGQLAAYRRRADKAIGALYVAFSDA